MYWAELDNESALNFLIYVTNYDWEYTFVTPLRVLSSSSQGYLPILNSLQIHELGCLKGNDYAEERYPL